MGTIGLECMKFHTLAGERGGKTVGVYEKSYKIWRKALEVGRNVR
jgi:hypothetical protein